MRLPRLCQVLLTQRRVLQQPNDMVSRVKLR